MQISGFYDYKKDDLLPKERHEYSIYLLLFVFYLFKLFHNKSVSQNGW